MKVFKKDPASHRIGRASAGFVAVLIALSCCFIFTPAKAYAHAVLMSSYPAANGTVSGPNVAIVLKYNSRVDPANSTISLLAPDGKVIKVAPAHPPAPNDLAGKVTGLSPGTYTLRWQALASDGHITRGEFVFHVK